MKKEMNKTKQEILIKTPKDIEKMKEGGEYLADVKVELMDKVGIGVSAAEIEDLACDLIKKTGGEPSFKMVPGYKWATCVNINRGVVHGIPKREIVFKKGDVVSIDIGLYYKGFHTDTSFTIGLQVSDKVNNFLKVGEKALKEAIGEVYPRRRVYDISSAIEKTIKKSNLSPIKALVGHGVGRSLHEEPQIPCFTSGKRSESPEIPKGAVLAIEVMYSEGVGDVVTETDGWTISTRDGKIAALFEETVLAAKGGPVVLTERL